MPNNKKYQIFISSTYADLIEERDAVRNVILEMYQFPIGMEMFSADDEDQWAVIKDAIDSSDYYVIIVGRKYGSIIENGDDASMSYTEKEFRYAQSTEIPILSFVIKDDAQRNGNQVEADPDKMQKLKAFTDYVKTGRLVSFWSNKDELAREVSTALHKQIDRGKRPGWVRADNFDFEKIAGELAESSKHIRELEEENRELRKRVIERKPILSVSLGIDVAEEDEDEDCLQLFKTPPKVSVNGGGLSAKISKINHTDYTDSCRPIEYNEEAKNLGVTQDEIQKYNEQLPDKKTIEKYNSYADTYNTAVQNGFAFTVNVNNTGTAKATDVRVTIQSCEGIALFDLDDIEREDEPQPPKLPENPIDVQRREQAEPRSSLLNLGHFFDYDFNETINSSVFNNVPSFKLKNSIHESTDVKNGNVYIEADQVLHPEGSEFRRFYMVPLKAGDYKLSCEIMCSEFKEPIHQELKINVIDEDTGS